MDRDKRIKAYNKLVTTLFDLDCLLYNTGVRAEYGKECREFDRAAVALQKAIESKI